MLLLITLILTSIALGCSTEVDTSGSKYNTDQREVKEEDDNATQKGISVKKSKNSGDKNDSSKMKHSDLINEENMNSESETLNTANNSDDSEETLSKVGVSDGKNEADQPTDSTKDSKSTTLAGIRCDGDGFVLKGIDSEGKPICESISQISVNTTNENSVNSTEIVKGGSHVFEFAYGEHTHMVGLAKSGQEPDQVIRADFPPKKIERESHTVAKRKRLWTTEGTTTIYTYHFYTSETYNECMEVSERMASDSELRGRCYAKQLPDGTWKLNFGNNSGFLTFRIPQPHDKLCKYICLK